MRSTFSAELNGLLDNVEQAVLVQIAIHEIMVGTERLIAHLREEVDTGKAGGVQRKEAGRDAEEGPIGDCCSASRDRGRNSHVQRTAV